MATKKNDDSVVRLQHVNGAEVTVSSDKAERLVAGGMFAPASTSRTKTTSDSK